MKITRHRADVAIVGSGIVGGSAALALCRSGLSVMLLERDYYGSHSSGVNFGGVRCLGRPLTQLPLASRAQEIWARLPELIGTDGGYIRSGHLNLARNEVEMAAIESYRDRTRGAGIRLHLLDKEALRVRFPWLGPRVIAASLCSEDGHANPRLVSQAFARAAAAAGADVRERTRIDDMIHDGHEFVLSSSDTGVEVRARFLLNCAGAWGLTVANRFGEAVPMISGHPLMAITEPLPAFINSTIGAEGAGIYARQTLQGHCVVGRASNSGAGVDENMAPNERVSLMMKRTIELVPSLRRVKVIRTWSGTEGYLPDGEPVIGMSATTPGLIHGFGLGGAGFLLGPAVGAVLAELVTHGESTTPIDTFAISRFARPKPEVPVDLEDSLHFLAAQGASAIRPAI